MARISRNAAILAALVGCSLPSALWIRSYWAKDVVYGWIGVPGYFQVDSSRGCLKVILNCERQEFLWKFDSNPPESFRNGAWHAELKTHRPAFGWWLDVTFPHYITVPFCGVIAVTAAWLWSRGFRVRTMLIGTAIVAILLGIVALAAR
jgi:hypothetical protein